MARFNAAKIFDAVDKKFQQVYNQLIDLLDTGYNTVAMVNGKKVEVTVSPQKPFELIIDDIKEIYVTESGVLVTSRYDVNEDGIVDQKDIDLVVAYIATGTGYLPRMDVNGDGKVNAIDLTLIYQHAVWTFSNPPPSIPETIDNISYVHRNLNTSMDANKWYRIAIESGLYEVGDGNVTRNSGLFEIDWTGTGVHGFVAFYIFNMYNDSGSTNIYQLAYSAVGAGFTKARIVYKNGDPTGEITAVELYLSSAVALTTNINIHNPIGWTYHFIDGDVPAGYTTNEFTFGNFTYQPLGNELTALQALADTTGFVIKTGDGAYSIDTTTYGTSNLSVANLTGTSETVGGAVDHGTAATAARSDHKHAITDLPAEYVTYARIQHVSDTDKILGRSSAGAGDIEEISCTSVARSLLDDTTIAAMRTTLGVGVMSTWNTTLTNLTIGSGTITSRYNKVGTIVYFELRVLFAADTTVDGDVYFSLPAKALSPHIIYGNIFDSGSTHYQVACLLSGANGILKAVNASGTYLTVYTTLSSTVPITWTTNDLIYLTGTYESET